MDSKPNRNIINIFLFPVMIAVVILSMVGIYFLSNYYVSPFQKIYFDESVSKVQNGGARNSYLELVLRPELRFDSNNLISKINVEPKVKFNANFKDSSLIIDFAQKLLPDTEYSLSFEKGIGLPTLDTFKYKFTTQKSTLTYLQEKNTSESLIARKVVGQEAKTLVKKPFIINYSLTPEYIIYAFRTDAEYTTPVQISIYSIQTQETKILSGKYDQFFEIISDEQSNQAIIKSNLGTESGKDNSVYSLIDLATLNTKPIKGVEGDYSTFLSFVSPQFVVYNSVTFSSNTSLLDLNNSKGTFIGKFRKVVGVDTDSSNICLNSFESSDKVFIYGSDGGITEIKLPEQETDEIVSNNTCDKIAYKTLPENGSSGFVVHIYDTSNKQSKVMATVTSVPAGEFVIDKSGKYIGYSITIGSGITAFNTFILHDENSFMSKKPLDLIKNASNVYIY
ncbi:MAG: hypothetical protein H7196_02580 [candidate division SR1 bacterium]|nr:hypothetical protein [candidate division SR1 bacterium]